MTVLDKVLLQEKFKVLSDWEASSIKGGQGKLPTGLIQVTGGNSNLYLMNPAGIVIGPRDQ